jgi:predicted GIY-YIG superfamily endonuclease
MDRNNKPIYVGMSKNVAQRLKAHPLKKTIIENNENFFITSMLINNYENRLMTESRLIKWFKPVLNKYHHPNRNVATGQLPIIEAI